MRDTPWGSYGRPWSAVVAAMLVAAVTITSLTERAIAQPQATRVITVVPVGPNGAPINGYVEVPPQGNVTDVADCTTPSPAAVADDIYYCSPSAASADVCWPSTPGSLLCVDDPWSNRLHRVNYSGPLPPVHPTATPQPFALVLDDGTRCRLRNGGAWGTRDDGYLGAYGCGPPNSTLAVLVLLSQGATSTIDRSTPLWTVKVGQLGAPGAQFPRPQTHTVATAWLAGDFVPV